MTEPHVYDLLRRPCRHCGRDRHDHAGEGPTFLCRGRATQWAPGEDPELGAIGLGGFHFVADLRETADHD